MKTAIRYFLSALCMLAITQCNQDSTEFTLSVSECEIKPNCVEGYEYESVVTSITLNFQFSSLGLFDEYVIAFTKSGSTYMQPYLVTAGELSAQGSVTITPTLPLVNEHMWMSIVLRKGTQEISTQYQFMSDGKSKIMDIVLSADHLICPEDKMAGCRVGPYPDTLTTVHSQQFKTTGFTGKYEKYIDAREQQYLTIDSLGAYDVFVDREGTMTGYGAGDAQIGRVEVLEEDLIRLWPIACFGVDNRSLKVSNGACISRVERLTVDSLGVTKLGSWKNVE